MRIEYTLCIESRLIVPEGTRIASVSYWSNRQLASSRQFEEQAQLSNCQLDARL